MYTPQQEHVNALAEACQSVGEAIEKRYEQIAVEEVHSLEWGTLDKTIEFLAPRKYSDSPHLRMWRYSYDGIPEWVGEDFPDSDEHNVTYMTLIEICVDYESFAPDWIRFEDGTTYYQMRQYVGSGERECHLGYDHETGTEGHRVGEADTKGWHMCPLCEEETGEEHGYIYLGNCTETVYKRVDFSCEECGLTAKDCTPDNPTCDCEVDND